MTDVKNRKDKHTAAPTLPADTLLKVNDLVKHFPITKGIFFRKQVGAVQAVSGVSFTVKKGETLGLVGESGDQGFGRGEDGHGKQRKPEQDIIISTIDV